MANVAMDRQREWNPNWALHPGEHLEEHLEERNWSQAEFARFSGLSRKLVSEIINGKNPVTPETALRLERVLGLKAYIWTGLQANWDLHQALRDPKQISDNDREWMSRQPVAELKRCGVLDKDGDEFDILHALMAFFRIGTPSAYSAKVASAAVHHRQGGGKGEVRDEYVFAWLMLGEWKAHAMDLPGYNRHKFIENVHAIRGLTTKQARVFKPEMKRLCAEAGVALVFEPAFPKTKLFGSARWIEGMKPVIQMSLRMKTNDHFWWTFFHECGHVLLHEGRNFADDSSGTENDVESEANGFAEEVLVGADRLNSFVAEMPSSKVQVERFARKVGMHPGVIVGMLQHRKVIPYSFMNDLKTKLEFKS